MKKKISSIIRYPLYALLALTVIAVGALYLWPLYDSELRNAPTHKLSYKEAQNAFSEQLQREKDNPNIKTACHSGLYDHGSRTEKVVVLLHGYTGCSQQYNALAQVYYDRGYNVYIPLAPHHGYVKAEHNNVEAAGLVSYTNNAINVAAGLGEEVGIVGISGGGVLATWAAEYRNDTVKRLLVLSPFYKPSATEAPSWQVKPFTILYGFGLLPDRFTEPDKQGFSYRALSQYLRIVANYKSKSELAQVQLTSVGVVTTPHDDVIDLEKARAIPEMLAEQTNSLYHAYEIPPSWQVGHDIVSPENPDINGRAANLYPIYIALYEGRKL